MSEQERKFEELESEFPSLSGSAFSSAFKAALRSGQRVLVAESDMIYEVSPDGTRKKVKKIEGPSPFKLGEKILLR